MKTCRGNKIDAWYVGAVSTSCPWNLCPRKRGTRKLHAVEALLTVRCHWHSKAGDGQKYPRMYGPQSFRQEPHWYKRESRQLAIHFTRLLTATNGCMQTVMNPCCFNCALRASAKFVTCKNATAVQPSKQVARFIEVISDNEQAGERISCLHKQI